MTMNANNFGGYNSQQQQRSYQVSKDNNGAINLMSNVSDHLKNKNGYNNNITIVPTSKNNNSINTS